MIIKVCGMREAENIRAVEQCMVDWIGFIFYPQSPRYVSERPFFLPGKAKRIGVFVDASRKEIIQRITDYELYGIQLHGHESPDFCCEMQTRGIKVIKALSSQAIDQCSNYNGACDYFLFDTPTLQHGGSGIMFDWRLLDRYQQTTPFLLSGGLGPESLSALLRWKHPQWAGIDLNSRFEQKPALKDVEKLQTFISQFRAQKEK